MKSQVSCEFAHLREFLLDSVHYRPKVLLDRCWGIGIRMLEALNFFAVICHLRLQPWNITCQQILQHEQCQGSGALRQQRMPFAVVLWL